MTLEINKKESKCRYCNEMIYVGDKIINGLHEKCAEDALSDKCNELTLCSCGIYYDKAKHNYNRCPTCHTIAVDEIHKELLEVRSKKALRDKRVTPFEKNAYASLYMQIDSMYNSHHCYNYNKNELASFNTKNSSFKNYFHAPMDPLEYERLGKGISKPIVDEAMGRTFYSGVIISTIEEGKDPVEIYHIVKPLFFQCNLPRDIRVKNESGGYSDLNQFLKNGIQKDIRTHDNMRSLTSSEKVEIFREHYVSEYKNALKTNGFDIDEYM